MYVITSDGVQCEFDPTGSKFLEGIIEDFGDDPGVIPLSNVDSVTLDKLIFWRASPDEVDEPWEVAWAMAHAADYLNMAAMLDKSCRALAGHLRGKSPAEIRRLVS
jgi:hypothetical protein